MPQESHDARVAGARRSISYERTLAFFEARGKNVSGNLLTATMYQSPALAADRDHAEKEIVLPLLDPGPSDRVLDLGCGSGRWAEAIAPAVRAYLGIDFSEGLLERARARVPGALFQRMNVESIRADLLMIPPPFTLIVCSGILAYLNDADALGLFAIVAQIAAPVSRIYTREPIAKTERLTLDNYWSEELGARYSAVYRSRVEYLELFAAMAGFRLCREGAPFPPEFQNRAETEQHFFILERP